METESPSTARTTQNPIATPAQDRRHRSIFDLSSNFFEGCRLISPTAAVSLRETAPPNPLDETLSDGASVVRDVINSKNGATATRWTCNTCKAEFESLQDQRSHFKSDIHRINVKLNVAGKDIVKEEDFDELTSESFDISSISGSEDEADRASSLRKGSIESNRQKLFIRLQTGERVSLWKSLLLNEAENVSYDENGQRGDFLYNDGASYLPCLRENEVIERLRFLVNKERNGSLPRIVLLASGGHFAGCVFDGNSVVVHKTFHRYVVRAKAGKKQSSKDASGRAAHSAGASLRRYNELGLKKDIQELLSAWKPYFDACSCVFIHAPSSNRQLLFDGDKPYFPGNVVRNVPLNVRRPTFKEAKRIYNQLTEVVYEVDEQEITQSTREDLVLNESPIADGSTKSIGEDFKDRLRLVESNEVSSSDKKDNEPIISNETESEGFGTTTPLHEAAQSGDARKVMELLEQGLDPCAKDERGRTPYMLANDKEARSTFRRFMASNPDKWDWHAAKVPSALTKEMEESKAAKQAEKDAKRKARAKELKKLRKAREKKAQAQTALSTNAAAVIDNRGAQPSVIKGLSHPTGRTQMSKEEELKRTMAIEREKRAGAAEKRIAASAAVNVPSSSTTTLPTQTKSGLASDLVCSCCNASLAGKVPFHRYNYKYCSTSCMHVHREIIEDG